jgi:pentatricopeptide repeat protein
MIDNGIKADVVCFTTLIDAYKRAGNIDRCWEIYYDIHSMELDDDIDEFLLSYMVRLTAATHDSEKAIKIFTELELEGYTEQAKPYNSIISALGSTKRHAEMAIDFWHQMQLKSISPD